MNCTNLLILFLGISFFFLLIRKSPSIKARRKRKNIDKAYQVIHTLRSFEGEGREARCLSYLRKINPYVFEELLLTAFQNRGFSIERNKRYSHDGGIDGKIFLNDKPILIQAKRYKSYVQAKHIRDFEQIVLSSGIGTGYFIHTGKTSKEVLSRYRNSQIKIISGKQLIKLILNFKNESE